MPIGRQDQAVGSDSSWADIPRTFRASIGSLPSPWEELFAPLRKGAVDDLVVVRPMCYLTLGHDHRLIDGAEGARFLRTLRDRLEHFDEALL
jgi:hypothetical protein